MRKAEEEKKSKGSLGVIGSAGASPSPLPTPGIPSGPVPSYPVPALSSYPPYSAFPSASPVGGMPLPGMFPPSGILGGTSLD